DLWAAGVILYESLLGAHPFEAETAGAILGHVLASPIVPVGDFRPDVPPELASIVQRCLQRDRSLRFSSALELLRALAPFGSPHLVAALLAGASEDSAPPTEPHLASGLTPVGSAPATRKVHDLPTDPTVQATPGQTPSAVAISAPVPVSVPSMSAGSHSKTLESAPSRDPDTVLEWNQERGRERSSKAWLLGGVGFLAGAALGAWFVFGRHASPSPEHEPAASVAAALATTAGKAPELTPSAPAAPPPAPVVEPSATMVDAQPRASAPSASQSAVVNVGPRAPNPKPPKSVAGSPKTSKPKDSILGSRD
ncbi:MAG TPA: hypothetical protein VGP93_05275, partial [Polyangiaceae bacterium]|nr:hypothetical protein [Polyangiaceae bacterium]